MRVLIIEDEKLSAEGLVSQLEKINSDIKILGICQSVKETVSWLENNQTPDLIFLDIHLADGLSFEIFNRTKVETPIIFTTAYDQYAIKAFKVNSVDYLLKPINQKDLQASLDKYKKLDSKETTNNNTTIDLLKESLDGLGKKYKSRFLVKFGNQLISLKSEEIAYFIAEDGAVLLFTKTNSKYLVNYSLDQLDSMLDPFLFFRINRKFILNINQITKVNGYFNNRLILQISPKPNTDVIVSRERVLAFKEWLDT